MWVAYEHFERTVGEVSEHALYVLRRLAWLARLAGEDAQKMKVLEHAYNIARQLYTAREHEPKLREYEEMVVRQGLTSDPQKALLVSGNVLERRAGADSPVELFEFRFYEAVGARETGGERAERRPRGGDPEEQAALRSDWGGGEEPGQGGRATAGGHAHQPRGDEVRDTRAGGRQADPAGEAPERERSQGAG